MCPIHSGAFSFLGKITKNKNKTMFDLSKKCGPECGPDCEPKCGPDCGPQCGSEHSQDEPAPDTPVSSANQITKMADTLVLVMFVVGIYAQIFSLFLYTFADSA